MVQAWATWDELTGLVMSLAAGRVGKAAAAVFLAARLRPHDA